MPSAHPARPQRAGPSMIARVASATRIVEIAYVQQSSGRCHAPGFPWRFDRPKALRFGLDACLNTCPNALVLPYGDVTLPMSIWKTPILISQSDLPGSQRLFTKQIVRAHTHCVGFGACRRRCP